MGTTNNSTNAAVGGHAPHLRILTAYLHAAENRIIIHSTNDGVYATIKGLVDVWAHGDTEATARQRLNAALEAHVVDSLFRHNPLPALDDVSLQIVERTKYGEKLVYGSTTAADDDPFLETEDIDERS